MRGEEAAAAFEFVEGESSDEFDESADELGEYLDDQDFGSESKSIKQENFFDADTCV